MMLKQRKDESLNKQSSSKVLAKKPKDRSSLKLIDCVRTKRSVGVDAVLRESNRAAVIAEKNTCIIIFLLNCSSRTTSIEQISERWFISAIAHFLYSLSWLRSDLIHSYQVGCAPFLPGFCSFNPFRNISQHFAACSICQHRFMTISWPVLFCFVPFWPFRNVSF